MRGAAHGAMRGAAGQGSSLVELLVALVVFQVGILGVAGMILMAQRNMMRAELTVRGVLEAQVAADSAKEAGTGDSGTATYPWGDISWASAPEVPGGVRAVVFAHHQGDTVAAVMVWPSLGTWARPLPGGTDAPGGEGP